MGITKSEHSKYVSVMGSAQIGFGAGREAALETRAFPRSASSGRPRPVKPCDDRPSHGVISRSACLRSQAPRFLAGARRTNLQNPDCGSV